MELKDKKVLLMGLGVLGGGLATARFLVSQQVDLTVTDMKDADYLKVSLEKLGDIRDKIKWCLGEHKKEDFLSNEVIVINPDVPVNNKFVQLAKSNGKQIENELTLFYKFCPSRKIVAVTGTRGKTTTVNWIYHFLKQTSPNTVLVGNSSENPFLEAINRCDMESNVVMEVPSYQLELLTDVNEKYAPKVVVITNIYQDHLNRHGSLEEYANTKANIFKNQKETDFLILNKDNEWTKFFLNQKPKSKVLFFSKNDSLEFIDRKNFVEKWGEHNLLNLFASILASKIMGVEEEDIKNVIQNLPQIKFRQEKIFENEKMEIYNDTAATSPDATVAALERFALNKENLILISGGTDRELEFSKWAEAIKKHLKPENLVLLSGSATEKMKKELGWKEYNEFETLESCVKEAILKLPKSDLGNLGKTTILFSSSSKSFEKFKNEFDRGEKFNVIVKQL